MANVTHAFHIADLHIRRSDERAAEYAHVFDALLAHLRGRPSVVAGSALIVIAGDVFEDKRALDPYAEQTFVRLVRNLTDLAPVVIIPGNHDFAQTEPDRPDRIAHTLTIMTTCGGTRHPVHYLRETGAHRVGNVRVCTASVYDTLSSTSGSGNVAVLPAFPAFPKGGHALLAPPVCTSVSGDDGDVGGDDGAKQQFTIAVAHMTVRGAACVHEAEVSEDGQSRGCTLAWFREAGHSTVMLGDEHVPRVWRAETAADRPTEQPFGESIDADSSETRKAQPEFVAAQPGSILAQTFGEPVRGHGVCEWDLAANTVIHHELANPFAGVSAVRARDGAVVFRTRGRAQAGIVTAAAARADPGFPRTPRVRLLGDVREHEVVRALAPEVVPSSFVVHELASAEEWLDAGVAGGNVTGGDAEDLREFVTKERMARYVREHAPDPSRAAEMADLVLCPETRLALPSYADAPAAVRTALITHQSGAGRGRGVSKRGASVDEALTAFGASGAPTRPEIAFVRLEGDWVTAYERLDLRLEGLPLTTLVDGPNGAGKSSVLDVLRIALYGIDGVCENRREFDTRRPGDKGARECAKPYNVVHAHKPTRSVARTRLTVRVGEGVQETFVVERQFGATRDVKPCVRRAHGDTAVCLGATQVRQWATRYFGDVGDVAMCAMVAQSRAASFMGMRASARKELIERTLCVDAIAHFGRALAENARGREKALAALDGALEDHNSSRPAGVPPEALEQAAAALAACEADAASADADRAAALREISSVRRASDAHASDPVPCDELARRLAAAELEYEQMACPETNEMSDAVARARDGELALAALGPGAAVSAAELEGARADLARAEADLLALGMDSVEAHEKLVHARKVIASATDACTAILTPHVQRSRTPEGRDASSHNTPSRADIDDLQARLRAMPAPASPMLVREWADEKAAWDALVARVGGACPDAARRQLARARERAELEAREARLVADLGNRADLQFESSCACCAANRDMLACADLQAELVCARDALRVLSEGHDAVSVETALAHLSEADEVARRSDDMARRAAEWARCQESDKARADLERTLSVAWWRAYDAQETSLDAARACEGRCLRVLEQVHAVELARDEVDARVAAYEAAAQAGDNRQRLLDEQAVLDKRVATLLEEQAVNEAAKDRVQAAFDRVRYAEVVALDHKARQVAAALADHQARQAVDGRAAEDAEAWARRERALLDIRGDLARGKQLVDAVLGLVVGNNGRGGYSAHVYEKVVLPRVSAAMNAFLERTASFRVVDSGGDLCVRFEASGAHSDLNQLGGADRFVLDLAARCALRQMGAPGFNWPVAFVDEGFVAFDATRRDRIGPILAAMVTVGGFSKLVVTSHLEAVKAVCERTLCIERCGEASRLVA